MSIALVPTHIRELYEVHEWRHACAVLLNDFPSEWQDILEVLSGFRLRKSWITVGGGSKSKVSDAIDSALYGRGWAERDFKTQVVVDETPIDSPTHKVDCYKNRIALEVEWNNKDPFYDRDLNNFRLLFELRAISVGVIVTRSTELNKVFRDIGRKASFGASTTHLGKLLPRVAGGASGGCPHLVFGITKKLYLEDV